MSVLLNIKRQQGFLPEYEFSVDKNKVSLTFPKNWLETHPVITADLQKEKEQLEKLNILLAFS
jgi:exopolyphosphatase/guanosine-5'-triphosphate,3'-diphosphate pyrophosphatase